MSGGGGMMGGAASSIMRFGGSVFSSIVGVVIATVLVIGGLGALAFALPMVIQGQQEGIETGVAVHAHTNVAIGAMTEAVKDGKEQRAYGAQLEREASAKVLEDMRGNQG